MRIKDYKIFEYTFLLFAAISYVILFYLYRHDKNTEIIITALGCVIYSSWGVIHHKLENRLNLSIVMEYLFVSILVFLIVLVALNVY
ncbi:hypothetical protein A2V49_00115 [candidate division WWE3 bacterium RBG_19FT_COMBO_34_6]|uniref:Uncharacterized protein n=1 Tax=candidate division WWE3 bacterium RBG_19FT_COMBO_34_6 TaxID=1802612 RepID=A0A1F4UJT7_UNCKA|nr:MAG: hypothetical protein A2V49_00115 [candidate division WWE3 bacterium RBG_19FT_COMBO_34_6]